MAIELKIDQSKYREALGKYNTELGKLHGYRDDLQKNINRMNGSNFSGSMVQKSIDKAKKALDAVDKAIEKAQKMKDSIEYELNKSQTISDQLGKDMDAITIPDLFK